MRRSGRKKLAKVRFGIVGMGVMGHRHAHALTAECGRDCSLAAVADSVPKAARKAGDQYGVPGFTDAQEMFESGLIDAAIVATPHYLHPVYTIRAARAGLHVLCEKPLAVTVGPARAMIRECKRHRVALAVTLQSRTRGVIRKMKRMVDSGRVGEVYRVSMTCSNWYRTQAYYDSGAWRGTWEGEGGGIMLNQAPHSLDVFQWIGGMPKRIMAIVGRRLHRIEVENVAQVICDYGGGKTGSIYLTSAEVPGVEQLQVVGDKGTLIYQNGGLRFGRLSQPISRHILPTSSALWPGTSFAEAPWWPLAMRPSTSWRSPTPSIFPATPAGPWTCPSMPPGWSASSAASPDSAAPRRSQACARPPRGS